MGQRAEMRPSRVTTLSLIARGTRCFRRFCLALSTILTSHWSVLHDLDRRVTNRGASTAPSFVGS